VITEGNTIIPVLGPDLLLMVMSPVLPRQRWKPDTLDLMTRADLVVINHRGEEDAAIESLSDEVAARRGGRRPLVQDISRPLAEWSDPAVRREVERLLAR